MTFDLIAELPVFLAYSLELEIEAAERLREFAAIVRTKDQPDLARTLEKLATFSERHAADIRKIGREHDLPIITTENYPELEETHPETCQFDDVGQPMSIRDTLEKALAQEKESASFYTEVANRTINRDIRKFALEFAAEEREHARALQEWLNKLPA